MLIEFHVENYKSFKDETNFSMVAAKIVSKNKKLDQENVFEVDAKLSLLKSAVIYGANASGKSNIHAALSFMRLFVLNSSKESQEGEIINVEPFRLSTETEEDSSIFEIIFILNSRKYRYGFEVTTQKIVSEWLFDVPTTRERKLFIRTNSEIDVKKSFKEGEGLEIRTRSNALFLSVVSQFNGKIAKDILNWFQTLFMAEQNERKNRMYTINCLENNLYKEEIVEFIKRLDLGISDIKVETIAPNLSIYPKSFLDKTTETQLRLLSKKSITTFHWKYDQDGAKIPELFDLDVHESEGTRRLFSLAGLLIDTLKNGRVLFVDEFDSSIHPLITCAIIDLFNSKDTNPKNAQIIFITHDTNLLSHNFRRDQIWFAEKDETGSTHLYSLAEYKIPVEEDAKEETFKKVRNDASFEDNYIHGKYGAIPFIGDLQNLLGKLNG